MTEATAAPESVPAGRGFRILVGLAAALVSALALRQFAGVLAPVFLAVVLSITVQPVRRWPARHHLPSWLGTALSLVAVYGLVVALVVTLVLAGAQFTTLLQDYAPELQAMVTHAAQTLQGVGMSEGQAEAMTHTVQPEKLIALVSSVVGGVAGVLSSVFFVIALLFFTVTDAGGFAAKLGRVSPGGHRLAMGFTLFARGTRQYLAVSTVFGLGVAICDVVALLVLDVRYAWLWGLLAFITNYIPNVGFVIGLLPPAIIALLDHGWPTAAAVVIVYCVLNVAIQTVIQPRVVGTAVGLSGTLSFLSLIIWTTIFGGLGALLAVPLSLFVKAQLVDVDPGREWLSSLLSSADGRDSEPSKS